MNDVNGVKIDFADEKLFPREFMIAKKNRQTGDKVAVQYVDVPDEKLVQMGVDFMNSTLGTV
jgi:hypothetical protein